MLSSDWRVLVRRWYILLAGAIATAGLAFAATTLVPLQYQVASNVLIMPPKSLDEAGRVANPYLDLGGLEGITDVICKALTNKGAAEALVESGRSGEYTMIRDPAAAAPVILVTVKTESAEDALSTQQYLLDRVPETLLSIQQQNSLRANAYITSTVITQDATATVIRKSQIRALLVAVVGGLGLTLFLAALIDGLLRSRGGRPRLSRVVARSGAGDGEGHGQTPAASPVPPPPTAPPYLPVGQSNGHSHPAADTPPQQEREDATW